MAIVMFLIILFVFTAISGAGLLGIICYTCATSKGLHLLWLRIFHGKAGITARQRAFAEEVYSNEPYAPPFRAFSSGSNISKTSAYRSYSSPAPVPSEHDSFVYESEPRVRSPKPQLRAKSEDLDVHREIYVVPVFGERSKLYSTRHHSIEWSNDEAEYHDNSPYLRGIIV